MNAINKIRASQATAFCPSCKGYGAIQHSPRAFSDDPYYCEERPCQDCNGGIITGDLAAIVTILEATHALQNLMIAARDQNISVNVTRNLQSAIDALDCVISDDLNDGAIFDLTKERAA